MLLGNAYVLISIYSHNITFLRRTIRNLNLCLETRDKAPVAGSGDDVAGGGGGAVPIRRDFKSAAEAVTTLATRVLSIRFH